VVIVLQYVEIRLGTRLRVILKTKELAKPV
jgi:hypothetical protein